jgi:pilus assembly protein Flp/PilA
MFSTIERFLREETGATSIEYGLIATLVAAACTMALTGIGQTLASVHASAAASIGSTSP